MRDIADQTRQVMNLDFYKKCFPQTVIRNDRNVVFDFVTTKGGGRLTGSFDSNLTGRGADIIIIDDAHSANNVSSPAVREPVIKSFDEMVVHRLNDPKTGRILNVGQRLHEDDLSGHLIRKGYKSLCLPFEATEVETIEYAGGVFRRAPGEVLHPERYGPAEVAALKRDTPSHVFATQFQQTPKAFAAGEVDRDDFPRCDTEPAGEVIFSWDTASTTRETSSYSVCLIFVKQAQTSYLKQIWRGRVSYSQLREIARSLHSRYKPTRHLIEEASLGIPLAADLSNSGAMTELIPPGSASKVQRFEAQLGNLKGRCISLPREAEWIDDFLDEIVSFPYGAQDDQVDALTQYLKWIGEAPVSPKFFSIGIGGGQGGQKQDSARYRDVIQRTKTRRF